MRKQIRTINESPSVKVGDKLIVGHDFNSYNTGNIYKVTGLDVGPNKVIAIDKVKPNGDLYAGDSIYYASDTLDQILGTGGFRKVTDEEIKSMTVSIEDIKAVVNNLGVLNVVNMSMNRLVRVSGKYIIIDMGNLSTDRLDMADKVEKALSKRGIKSVNLSGSIFIDKVQV